MKKLNIVADKREDLARAKKLFKDIYERNNGDRKKIQRNIVNSVVNNPYIRSSNEFVQMVWDEFNKQFSS